MAEDIIVEMHAGKEMVWLPVMLTLVYGFVMLYLNWKGKVDGPYPFFRVRNQGVRATILWMSVLLIAMTGISSGVWVFAK